MQKKLPGSKKRVRYWKDLLTLQNRVIKRTVLVDKKKGIRKKMSFTQKSLSGKNLPIIKKDSKKYQIIVELARMPPPELIRTAKKYYTEDIRIKQMLSWYKEGTIRQERRREGRKYIEMTVGFPKGSKYLAQMIRYRIINIERGMTPVEREPSKVKRIQKKPLLKEFLKKNGYSDEAIKKMTKEDMQKIYKILKG